MTKNDKPRKEIYDQWHNDPANWRWGIFYFNKNDKRWFPPKRIKQFGWTANFANPLSILSFVVLIILILVFTRLIVEK